MSFYVSTATFFLLHCDEWDRVVALPRHKFVTGATLLQLTGPLLKSMTVFVPYIYFYIDKTSNSCIKSHTGAWNKLFLSLDHSLHLVTIHVNIMYYPVSMHKHKQGRTFFFTPARFKSCLFFKFLLIYSKPCLVQLSRPYSFKKISWPPLDYLLWRRNVRFCQEVRNSLGFSFEVRKIRLRFKQH